MYQSKCQNTKTFSFPIFEISRKTIAICKINLDLSIVIDNIISIFWQFDNVVLISDEIEITIVGINKCTFVRESERISSEDSVRKVLTCNLGPQFMILKMNTNRKLVYSKPTYWKFDIAMSKNVQQQLDFEQDFEEIKIISFISLEWQKNKFTV